MTEREKLLTMFNRKAEAAAYIGKAICTDHDDIEDVTYHWWWLNEDKLWYEEEIHINYKNGRTESHSANGDNSFGLMSEVLKMVRPN